MTAKAVSLLRKSDPSALVKMLRGNGITLKVTDSIIASLCGINPGLNKDLETLALAHKVDPNEAEQEVYNYVGTEIRSDEKETPRILGISQPILVTLVAVILLAVAVKFFVKK